VATASKAQFRLVRVAMIWLVVAGAYGIYLGAGSVVNGDAPAFYALDALRHVLTLGVVTSVILGMSLLILPEFAGERAGPNRQAILASVLVLTVVVVTVLRAGAAVLGTDIAADYRNLAMAAAGLMIEAALVVVFLRFVLLSWRLRHGTLVPLPA
jgi:hypothetical protein